MANRYWVGGSGTWNTTSTTNWSASSGGASGASVPTAADSVFFDQAGPYTVTMTGALTCLDFTTSNDSFPANTITFATGTSPTLAISGSMRLAGSGWTSWTSTGAITFNATTTGKTITTNGLSFPGAFATDSLIFNGFGGGWTLGSSITFNNGRINVTAGTFNTGNFNVTADGLVSTSGGTRSIVLGSSTLTIGGSTSGGFSVSLTSPGLTWDAGTSQINITASSTTFAGAGLNFYNVAFTVANASARTVTGANTYNNFAVTASPSAGTTTVTFNAKQTINGTLSTTGTAGNRRVFFASATYGISVDLAVNSAPSLTDADFRGLYVTGTSAPISGTRIGNRGECRNITFSTPKTVYWNLAGVQNWSANGWAATSTGSPSTDNFPLPQDTATFTNAGGAGSIQFDTAISYVSNVDLSARSTAITILFNNPTTVYGNWTNGSGIAFTGTSTLTFSGGTTQTITSAGKTFSCAITVDAYGGTVQLADALNIGSNVLTVTNGTFNTQGYAVSAGGLSSTNSNVRTITLGASTVTCTNNGAFLFTTSTNLTFNAGTSQLNHGYGSLGATFDGGSGLTFYNVSFTYTAAAQTNSILGANTFNNLTIAASASAGLMGITFNANQTINGTLTCAGASAVQRIFLRSNTIGTPRTLTVNSLSATDCDFRDIVIAGAAAGTSPTRAGDCGGNSGITFPAAKTVYWNLAGAQNWSATGWCTGSGGTPDINQFPLAQDTAKFDEAAGSVTGTITINAAWNIGTFDASARTSAMTLTTSTNSPVVYGDWKFGTGVTSSNVAGVITFSKNGTQTITSNGVQFGCPVTINHPSGTVQLADALSLGATRTLTLTSGTFDAVTYNVTTGLFTNSATTNTLKMGSGTWTLTGTGTSWNCATTPIIIAGTSTIVISCATSAQKTFSGGSGYYNKVTWGGAAYSGDFMAGSPTIGELASTRTTAWTLAFTTGTTTTIGKWSITGSAGNVVTLTTGGSAYTIVIAGPAVTGVDYLAIGASFTVSTTSPGEFYAGANSTGGTNVILTAAPAPRTLYWVGGTGNWSSTTKWSTSSGGASGAAIPTSLDAVVFNSASNATAYTATIDAGVTIARCASFTMAGPLTGNVTFAGTVPIAFHGNVSFAATGITRTYSGDMYWAGNSSYTFTTNGLSQISIMTVIGIGSTWTLGSALNTGTTGFTVTYGSFSTSSNNYSFTTGSFLSTNSYVRSISFNSSSLTFSGSTITFLTNTNLTFNAGTSTISSNATSVTFSGAAGLTFNTVNFTAVNTTSIAITGANTFNTLSFAGRTSVGVTAVTFSANQTIGTLTLNAGTSGAYRTFLASNTIGTQRTLTVTTLTAGAADYDFRDIAITGAASPLTGTRFGDAKGNSGITFPAAKTVYWRNSAGGNWGSTTIWSATNGGTADSTQFPLPQDTAVFPSSPTPYPASGNTVTINVIYNIGTIDMSARTSNTMTLATGTTTPAIYGDWINGTGTTLTGTGNMTFAGRGSQTITSAGKTFTQAITISSPSGSVTLQDAYSNSVTGQAIALTSGEFNAGIYNVSLTNGGFASGANTTVSFGSGTWTLGGSGIVVSINNFNNASVISGTATVSLTSASSKSFSSDGANYSGITLNQGGAGALTITGNNTFKDITNTYSATGAATINLAATTTTLTQFTGTGAATRLLTLSGTSAASPATLILSSGTVTTPDYLSISNVRAYSLSSTWYAGANSTNLGSLGWIFAASGGVVYNVTITETSTGTDAVSTRVAFNSTASDTATGTDSITAGILYLSTLSETATGTDSVSASFLFSGVVLESASATETVTASATFRSTAADTATGTDAVSAPGSTYNPSIAETGTASDLFFASSGVYSAIVELATGTDTMVGKVVFSSAFADTATGADSITARVSLTGQITETASGADLIFGRLGAVGTILESATGTDAFSAASQFGSAVLELATGSDIISAKAQFAPLIFEVATITEAVTAPGSTYNPTIVETATGTATDVGYVGFATAVLESATGSDAFAASAAFSGVVLNTATATDAVSSLASFGASLAESATGTDLFLVAPSVFNAPVFELATVTDALTAPGSIYNPSLVETIVISDFVIGGYLWNPIDDTQTPDWGVINNAQVSGWTQISDTQTPNWQNVNNSQTTAWGEIDDSQNPGWVNIQQNP